MTGPRKRTVFVLCVHHGALRALGARRLAETFCEGGPAYGRPCIGHGCSIRPGTDLYDESICYDEYPTTVPGIFGWAVNNMRVVP